MLNLPMSNLTFQAVFLRPPKRTKVLEVEYIRIFSAHNHVLYLFHNSICSNSVQMRRIKTEEI